LIPKNRGGFLGWLVRVLFLWNAGSGIFRAIGAWQQRSLLPKLGLPGWLPWYLLVAGLLIGLLNLAAYLSLRLVKRWAVPLAWAALFVTLAGYWLERLLLWAPEQRSGNVLFMVVFHVLCLAVLSGYTYRESKMRGEHGSGN